MCPVFSVCSYALENWPDDCYVASEGACLMDAGSGTVLFGKNQDEAYYPASITKVMTALVVLENCDNLSEQVTFSYDAVHIEEENSTIIGASEGDRLSVLDCLYCLLFQSANEVANALGEHVGAKHPELKDEGMNDRAVFVKMMNMKAAELGCKGTHFNNPSGLTDENHYTTAYDMCLIMAAAIEDRNFLDIESRTYWTHAPIRRYPDAKDPWNTVYPKHSMIKRNSSQYYSGTIAGKTGYTMTAGNTLVTACRRDGMTLVTCVLNAHANHYNDTRRLMDFGFNSFQSLSVIDYDNTNDVIAKDFSIAGIPMVDSMTLGMNPETRITIPKSGSYIDVRKTLRTGDTGKPGILAELEYTYGDRIVGNAEIKLIDISGSSALVSEAGTDPLLSAALGIEPETSAAAAEAGDGSADEGAASDGGAAANAGAANESSAGSAGAMQEGSTADGEKADKGAAGNRASVPSADSSTEGVSSGEAVSPADDQNGGEPSGSTAASGRAADAGDSGDKEGKKGIKGFIKPVLIGAGGLAGLFIIMIIIGAVKERKQARARALRRKKRLERTSDVSGTQQIKMDLEMQRRRRGRKKKR